MPRRHVNGAWNIELVQLHFRRRIDVNQDCRRNAPPVPTLERQAILTPKRQGLTVDPPVVIRTEEGQRRGEASDELGRDFINAACSTRLAKYAAQLQNSMIRALRL